MSNIASSRDEVLSKIQPYLLKHCYKFVGFVEPYRNSRNKIKIECPKHGVWSVSIRHVCSTDCGCPVCGRDSCSIKKSQNQDIILSKILNKCDERGYIFQGFVNEYRNRKSKINVECQAHGVYVTNINNFIDSDKGCPGCSANGFNKNKEGFLYALRSECGQHVKIGITNNPQMILKTLRARTPFDFHPIEIIKFQNGKNALMWESIFHNTFCSSGLRGFDGCTEWLKWSTQISEWLRFIASSNSTPS